MPESSVKPSRNRWQYLVVDGAPAVDVDLSLEQTLTPADKLNLLSIRRPTPKTLAPIEWALDPERSALCPRSRWTRVAFVDGAVATAVASLLLGVVVTATVVVVAAAVEASATAVAIAVLLQQTQLTHLA